MQEAQREAESPDATDDSDKTWKGAAVGAPLGPAGMLVGGFFGHQKDEEEKEKAHNRMVQLVAGLGPGVDSAVEHADPLALDVPAPETEVVQHPPQPRGDPATGVVVADHDRAVADRDAVVDGRR